MPNRTLPEFWLYDPTINDLRVHAREFLFRLALKMDNHWRCFVGRHPTSPDFLRAALYPLIPQVRLTDVSRCLAEVQEAGVLLVRDSERGWYVELVESFRYRKEDYPQGQPKYGPRKTLPPPPDQRELTFPPVALPAARVAKGARKNSGAEFKRIDCDHDHVHDDDSARSAENRALSREGAKAGAAGAGAESEEAKRMRGVYSATAGSKDDEVWRDLCEFLTEGAVSCPELWNSGKLWLSRLENERRAVAEAVQEARLLEKEGYPFKNRGSWLGDLFERCRGRRATG